MGRAAALALATIGVAVGGTLSLPPASASASASPPAPATADSIEVPCTSVTFPVSDPSAPQHPTAVAVTFGPGDAAEVSSDASADPTFPLLEVVVDHVAYTLTTVALRQISQSSSGTVVVEWQFASLSEATVAGSTLYVQSEAGRPFPAPSAPPSSVPESSVPAAALVVAVGAGAATCGVRRRRASGRSR